jgi:homoserine dehydrogenase
MHPVDGASISVLKFGGSVLCNRSALAGVATEVARFRRTGRAVLAVVSALQGRTDALLAECAHVSPPLSPLAVAARVASGERECAAMLAEALSVEGLDAAVLDPAALQLLAEGDPLDADPVGVSLPRCLAALGRSGVAVVPGFVAVDGSGNAVLLGRGGSDLTALFLAQRLAAHCRLVKDVDGLFQADPADGPAAGRVAFSDYAELLLTGGRLVQAKAVAFAAQHQLVFEIGSLGSHAVTRIGPPGTSQRGPSTTSTAG